MGLSEKSGSPFCVLKKVERIAKNRVSGAKMVPKTKTPANSYFCWSKIIEGSEDPPKKYALEPRRYSRYFHQYYMLNNF